jgi:hypothetical protein
MPALLISRCRALPEARNASAKLSTELASIRSSFSISTFSIPFRFCFAFSTSLAATITVAPALASVFTVSRPIPVPPPVTIAVLPLRSIPFITSLVVDVELNPEPIGFCKAPL